MSKGIKKLKQYKLSKPSKSQKSNKLSKSDEINSCQDGDLLTKLHIDKCQDNEIDEEDEDDKNDKECNEDESVDGSECVAEFISCLSIQDGIDKEDSHDEVETSSSSIESILYKVPYVDCPLIGTPKQVQEELDNIVMEMKEDPNSLKSNETYNRIHLYMHGYLINVALKQFPYIKGYQTSDIYQESLIALRFKAIPNFQNNRGMSFLNFAKMCIRRHLITLLNTSNKRKRDQSMNQAISMDVPMSEDDDGSTLLNTLKDETMTFDILSEKKEAFEFTKDVLSSSLSDFEKEVLQEYLSNSSYREIARSITIKTKKKCAPKAVDNALLRIRKKAIGLKDTKEDEDLPMFI